MKDKIPVSLKRLFDYGTMKDEKEPREYKFCDFEGKERIAYLGSADLLSKEGRCPKDGVRIANYSGDPHRVAECPNCGYSPSHSNPYSREKDLADLAERIKTAEVELARLKATRQVVENPKHPIVKFNQRDELMSD